MTVFFCTLLATALPAKWIVTDVHELFRSAEPATLSGVTWVSNDTYLAATDWNPALYELTIPLDPQSARPIGCTAKPRGKLVGCTDVEDIASDPLDRRRVFAVDEHRGTISCHSVTGGPAISTQRLTGALSRTRLDMGLESLALSRDGRTLWTANEEATKDDGPVSSRKHGTDVRLARFRRTSATAAWQADGEWVYRTDPIAGSSMKVGGTNADRSGVSALCLLEDGTLLAHEREFSIVILPRFRCRLYEINFTGATDVASCASVSNAAVARVGKRLLHETTGLAMYEGICEGPRCADGATALVLVSDADHCFMAKSVMTLKLEKRVPVPSPQ